MSVYLIPEMHLCQTPPPSHLLYDLLPGLGQTVQAGLHVLLVELNLFIVHFCLLVQPINGQLKTVQFLLALLTVAVLVANILHTQARKSKGDGDSSSVRNDITNTSL